MREKIQSLSRRRNIYSKENISKVATKFRRISAMYSIFTNKAYLTLPVYLVLFADVTGMYAADRKYIYVLRKLSEGQFNENVMWELEHKHEWRYDPNHLFFSQNYTHWGSSSTERTNIPS
jgi:hypothetical protein